MTAALSGEATEPDERDLWLTYRWPAYTRHVGILIRQPVSHEPWPLRTARLVSLTQTMTTGAGLPAPGGDPNVRYSDGVTGVAVGLPQMVRQRMS